MPRAQSQGRLVSEVMVTVLGDTLVTNNGDVVMRPNLEHT